MKSGVPVCKPQGSSDSLESSTPRSASAHDLEKVSPAQLDWGQILARLRQRKAEAAMSSVNSVGEAAPEDTSEAPSDKNVQARPVATPARALPEQATAAKKWMLPKYVVQQLQKKEEYVPPFDTRGADDGEDVAAIDAELAEAPKKKRESKKTKKGKSRRKPRGKKETLAVEDEAALTEEAPGVPAVQAAQAPAEHVGSTIYEPGKFSEARANFIKAARAEHGIKHAAANDMWMASDLRASFLSGMSVSEMKKRRFM